MVTAYYLDVMTDTSAAPSLKAELAVIGAGPVGTSLAILAARAGFTTLLVDARDPDRTPPPDTRNFAIVRGSWRLLGAAGVHPALDGHTQPLMGLEATDGGRHWMGAPSVLFGTGDLPEDQQGEPLGQMVPAAALQAALDEVAAATPNLTWLRNTRFTGMTPHPAHARLTLHDGRTVDAGLVAACDGMRSGVRNALGIKTEGRAYGKSVFAADVKLSRPHKGLARQLFTPEGPFATLPLPGNRANLAWYLKTGAAEAMAAMPAEDIEAELNARFADFAGEMKLDGQPLAYPLHLQIATEMVGPRTALLGDAARRINPLAGQGLNLGFKDVGALVDVMSEAREVGLDPGADTSLHRYQQWRRFDAATTAMFMDGVDRIFSNDNAVLKPLRGLALMAASKIGPVRRAMARQASADQADLPSLMR
mgnify:FL=1